MSRPVLALSDAAVLVGVCRRGPRAAAPVLGAPAPDALSGGGVRAFWKRWGLTAARAGRFVGDGA